MASNETRRCCSNLPRMSWREKAGVYNLNGLSSALVTGNMSDHSIYLRVSGVYVHEKCCLGTSYLCGAWKVPAWSKCDICSRDSTKWIEPCRNCNHGVIKSKCDCTDTEVFGHKIFSRGPSMRLVSIAALAQALNGLGTGRSPSSSGCSPSAHALLSRAQSRSSTLSSAPIMHFLTRPSCRGPLVKFCQPE
jgi:hypothetical protein